MPIMPRIKGFATKIAFQILGKPANMKPAKKKPLSKIDQRIAFENTSKVR